MHHDGAWALLAFAKWRLMLSRVQPRSLLDELMARAKYHGVPGAFFWGSYLEAMIPRYWDSYLKMHVNPVLDLLRISPRERVMDVGAHIGLFTVPAAKSVGPEGMVVAVEPELCNLRTLAIRSRGFANIVPVQAVVWGHPTTLDFCVSLDSMWHSAKQSKPLCRMIKVTKVRATIIDRIASAVLGGKVDVLKASVEGAEIEALQGAQDTLSSCRAIVIDCVTTPSNLADRTNTVLEMVAPYGFEQVVLPMGATWNRSVCLRRGAYAPNRRSEWTDFFVASYRSRLKRRTCTASRTSLPFRSPQSADRRAICHNGSAVPKVRMRREVVVVYSRTGTSSVNMLGLIASAGNDQC